MSGGQLVFQGSDESTCSVAENQPYGIDGYASRQNKEMSGFGH